MISERYSLNDTIHKVVHRQGHVITFNCFVAFVFGIGSAFALGLGRPGPYYFWLGMSCLSIVYLSNKNIALGICLVLILNPLLFFVRNASPESIVLAGARSEWMMSLIFVWLIKLSQNKCRWPHGLDVNILFLFLSYATLMALFAPSFVAGLLGIRALVMPPIIYFVVRDCVNRQPGASYLILNGVLLSVVIIGILSIFWYYGHLEMKALKYSGVLIGSARIILNYFFERLSSLIGGGPSNVGIFLGAGFMISLGFLQGKILPKRSKMIFICSGSLCAYTSLLTVSRSVAILLMVALSAFALSGIASRMVRTVFLCITVTLFLGVVIGTSFQGVRLIDSAKEYSFVWQNAMPDNSETWLFGGGLNAAGGGLLGKNAPSLPIPVDSGWPQILSMVGLIGTSAIILLLLFFVVTYYKLASISRQIQISNRDYVCAVTAGCTMFGLLISSVHTAVIFRPVVDIVFYALAAVMVSIYSNYRRRRPVSLQREERA